MSLPANNQAKENGNRNWDTNLSYFCENIQWKLCNLSIYTEEELIKIRLVMDYLKYTGEYASNNSAGAMENSIAYTRDNLYDIMDGMEIGTKFTGVMV